MHPTVPDSTQCIMVYIDIYSIWGNTKRKRHCIVTFCHYLYKQPKTKPFVIHIKTSLQQKRAGLRVKLTASFICPWLSKVPRENVRQGLLANTTHSPNAGTMLCQRHRLWPNNVPALGERLLFATSWKGSLVVSCV